MPDQLLTQPHGGPMLFFLDGVDRPERERLCRLVSEHGGRVVVNPARHPHCVTLSEGEPGSQRRPLFSDEEDAFSTRFLDDCVSAGRVVDLGPYRLQPVSLYVGPDRSQDVLRGLISWSQLVVAGKCSSSDDDDPRLILDYDRPPAAEGAAAGQRHRGRLKFTRAQDEALVRFVGEQWRRRTTSPPTGRLFWELKAHLLPPCLAGHPPLSLQTRLIKQVRPRLSEFKSSVPLPLLATAAAAAGVRLSFTDDERLQLERPPPPAVQDREEPAPSHGSSRHTGAAGEERAAGTPAGSGPERTDDSPASRAGPQSRPGTDGAGGTTADRPSNPVQSGSSNPVQSGSEHSASEMGDSDSTVELPPWQQRRLVKRPAERPGSQAAGDGQPDRREGSSPDSPPRASSSLSPEFSSSPPPGPADAGASGLVQRRCRRSATDRNSAESQNEAGPSHEPEPGSAQRLDVSDRTTPRRHRRRVVSREFVSDSEEESSPPPAPEQRQSPPAAGSAAKRSRPRRPSSSSSSDVSSSAAAADRGSPAPSDSGSEGSHSSAESAGGSSSSSEAEHPAALDPGRDGLTRRWRLYTPGEEETLLRQVLKMDSRGAALGGRRAWQRLEQKNLLPGRSWQSLKQHWRCSMAPRLSQDGRLTASQRRRLSVTPPPPCRPQAERRRPYTRQEDIAILQFLEEAPRRIRQVNGRLLWQHMARQVEGRTWQSLKERFVKRISPNLASFGEVSLQFRRDIQRWLHGECHF